MMTVASQTSPSNGIQPQNHVIATEQPPGKQTAYEPVPFLSCSNSCSTDFQESGKYRTTTFTGDPTIPPLTITTPLNEERLVRDEQINDLCLPLTSTVILKRMLYVPLDFENNLAVDALVDSRFYVSAIPRMTFNE